MERSAPERADYDLSEFENRHGFFTMLEVHDLTSMTVLVNRPDGLEDPVLLETSLGLDDDGAFGSSTRDGHRLRHEIMTAFYDRAKHLINDETVEDVERLSDCDLRFGFHRGEPDGDPLVLQTACDPVTGLYMQPVNREVEPGYASYMAVLGEQSCVVNLVDAISENATVKDGGYESNYSGVGSTMIEAVPGLSDFVNDRFLIVNDRPSVKLPAGWTKSQEDGTVTVTYGDGAITATVDTTEPSDDNDGSLTVTINHDGERIASVDRTMRADHHYTVESIGQQVLQHGLFARLYDDDPDGLPMYQPSTRLDRNTRSDDPDWTDEVRAVVEDLDGVAKFDPDTLRETCGQGEAESTTARSAGLSP